MDTPNPTDTSGVALPERLLSPTERVKAYDRNTALQPLRRILAPGYTVTPPDAWERAS